MRRPSPTPAPGAATAGDPYLPTHGNGGYRSTRYELELDYRVVSNHLSGRARLSLLATQPLSRFSLDLGGLRVAKVTVDGRRPARYAHRGQKLHVWPAAPVEVGAGFVVEVHYSGNPQPLRSPWGEVGWEELTDGVIVAGQPSGAPSWFPCNDHPADKASYRISVTTDAAYEVVANGTLVEQTRLASRRRWVFDQPEPMSTYLATVQVGRYQVLELAAGPVPQRAAVPARLTASFRHDFGRQPEMMALFERLFGPYPFAEYLVVVTDDDLEMPLEAQGLAVFGANHLDGRRGLQRLVAHELAHQWFGNSLTAGTWQHIWLHEGFACYAEWLWSEHCGGPSAQALALEHWARLDALPQDLVVGDPGAADMFDDRVYKRGALTLHALRLTLGDDPFFAALREWTGDHRHGVVTTQDFVDCASRHTDVPVHELFRGWLDAPGLPPLPGGPVSRLRAARRAAPPRRRG